jgi:catechol 2,3-dioxygenase-like lactoylglutathione lyase family enzyme
MQVLETIPILRMFDVAKAKDFYVGFLGFKVDWEHQFEGVSPIYMQVSRDGLTLHLSEHHGDGTPGTVVYLRVTGLREFHQEIQSKGYGYMNPGLDNSGLGSLEVCVTDPFGNTLRINEDLGGKSTA